MAGCYEMKCCSLPGPGTLGMLPSPWIRALHNTGNLDQRFSAETQQQCVDEFLVLQCELCQKPRHRENDVSIGDRKKFFLSPLDPTPASVGLTFWAMPITTGVIGGDSIPATWTLIEMTAESSGPAAFDRFQDLPGRRRRQEGCFRPATATKSATDGNGRK